MMTDILCPFLEFQTIFDHAELSSSLNTNIKAVEAYKAFWSGKLLSYPRGISMKNEPYKIGDFSALDLSYPTLWLDPYFDLFTKQ